MGNEFACLDAIDNFGGAIVVHADLIKVDFLPGLRIRTQSFEYLDGHGVSLTSQLLGNGVMERLAGRRILENGKILGGHES